MKNDNAKKLLSILCAASLAFSLAACGSVDASDPDETGTPAQIETAAPGGDQTPPEKPDGEPGGQGGPGGSFGGSSTVTQGESANTITTDGAYTGETYTSAGETVTFSAQNGNGDRSDHGVFIAYAPAENPEVAISVVMENGTSTPAHQVARQVLDAYFASKSTGTTPTPEQQLLP